MLVFANQVHPRCSRQIFQTLKRALSTAEVTKRQNELFSAEQKRQIESVGRIEKIEIKYLGVPQDTTLVMNKDISTPFNCAQHLGEVQCKQSALALLDNRTVWDMHRPLTESCTLQFLNFHDPDPYLVNKVFWRSCSFFLGAALKNAFREDAEMHLYSFPAPNIRSGSFVYNFSIKHGNWIPGKVELRAIGAEMRKLAAKNLKVERLDVNHDLALDIFEHNPFKREQLPSVSHQNDGIITLYRVGDHIDISRGPMIGSTSLLGRCVIAAIHEIPFPDRQGTHFYRAQGVALPLGVELNHFAFKILEERAAKLNTTRLPTEQFEVLVEATA